MPVARVLITGSADGLGLMAARQLIDEGHEVFLHARDDKRAESAMMSAPGAAHVLVGDLASIVETTALAGAANGVGRFDAVIHNAAVGSSEPRRIVTPDWLSHVFAINVLAPYLLTALMELPERLVYLSSGMNRSGRPDLDDLQWERRAWNGSQAYADSKLFVAALAAAVGRLRPGVYSNAVDPGWVATKMGGRNAPDDLSLGPVTQAWLAVSSDPEALVTGAFFFHQRPVPAHRAMHDVGFQDRLLEACASASGVRWPDPQAA